MRTEFVSRGLRCPTCRTDFALRIFPSESDAREVRTGTLACVTCGAQRPMYRGVADLMPDPPGHVAREAAGLKRFADTMRASGWTAEMIRSLPYVDSGYWYVQAVSIEQLAETVELRPGQRLLDLGSNTCWASNFFARRGLDVVALDISLWDMQGLWTADLFLGEEGGSYFERVLGSMDDIPLASESLDYVYACEVLHHNDIDGLQRTFDEAFRVLVPGGRMLIINETLKSLRDRSGVHLDGVADYEGYEHAHWALQYQAAALRAGFTVQLLEPRYHRFFMRPERWPTPPLRNWRGRVSHALSHHAAGRRLYLWWLYVARGETGFNMIATKPGGRAGAARSRALRRLRGRRAAQRSSATRGAIRLNTQKPSTKMTTTIPIGTTSSFAPPSA